MATVEDEDYRSRGPIANAISDWGTCVHEAAHAVVGERDGIKVDCATVIPEKDTLGHVDYRRLGLARCLELAGDHRSTVAGYTAESLVCEVRKSQIWTESRFYHLESTDFKSVVKAVRDRRAESLCKKAQRDPNWGRSHRRYRQGFARPRTTKADRIEAWRIWKRTAAELRSQFRRDPSWLRQIFAVAKELSLRRELSGDEVRQAMAAAAMAGAPSEERL